VPGDFHPDTADGLGIAHKKGAPIGAPRQEPLKESDYM